MSIDNLEAIENAGIILVNNRFVEIAGMKFGGLNSKQFTGQLNTGFLEQFQSTDGYRVLLCHHPEYYDTIQKYGFDLMLSGHCHGGQMRIFGRGLFSPGQGFFPRYTHGIYHRMVVTSGAENTSWLPRFGNPCEIVLLELGPGKTNLQREINGFFEEIEERLEPSISMSYASLMEEAVNLWEKELPDALGIHIDRRDDDRNYRLTIEIKGRKVNPFDVSSFSDEPFEIRAMMDRIKSNMGYELHYRYHNQTNRATLKIPKTRTKERLFLYNLLLLMLPLSIQGLLQNVASTVDTLMLGHFSQISMSASALATTFLTIQIMVISATKIAETSILIQLWAKRKRNTIRQVYRYGMCTAGLIATVFFALCFIFPDKIMAFYTNNTEIIKDGVIYLRISAFAYAMKSFSAIRSGYLTVLEKERAVMLWTLLCNGLNILLNLLLIFGCGRIAPMGIRGAAWATLISALAEALGLFFLFRFSSDPMLDREEQKNAYGSDFFRRFGFCALQYAVYMIGMSCIASAFGHLDTGIMAVFSVISTVSGWLSASRDGLLDSAVIQIGSLLGKGKIRDAERMSRLCERVGIVFGVAYAAIFTVLTYMFSMRFVGADGIPSDLFTVLLCVGALNIFASVLTTTVQGAELLPGGDLVSCLLIDLGFTIFVAAPLLIFGSTLAKVSLTLYIILLKADEIIKYPFFKFRELQKKWLKS